MPVPDYNLSLRPYAPVPEGPATLAVEDHGMAALVDDADDAETGVDEVMEYMREAYPPIVLMSERLILHVSVN